MGKKILVVDDEKLIVKGLRFSLLQDGYEVDCAYDGEEALSFARNNRYSFVLSYVPKPSIRFLTYDSVPPHKPGRTQSKSIPINTK